MLNQSLASFIDLKNQALSQQGYKISNSEKLLHDPSRVICKWSKLCKLQMQECKGFTVLAIPKMCLIILPPHFAHAVSSLKEQLGKPIQFSRPNSKAIFSMNAFLRDPDNSNSSLSSEPLKHFLQGVNTFHVGYLCPSYFLQETFSTLKTDTTT